MNKETGIYKETMNPGEFGRTPAFLVSLLKFGFDILWSLSQVKDAMRSVSLNLALAGVRPCAAASQLLRLDGAGRG